MEYSNKIYIFKILFFLIPFSLMLEDNYTFNYLIISKISIFELLFILIFTFSLVFFKYEFVKHIFSLPKKNIFYASIICIFILKIIKSFLSDFSSINLYETLIWLYLFIFFANFSFLIDKNILDAKKINHFFKLITFVSSILIFTSFILYKLNYKFFNLWEVKENVHQPYFGENSIHFNGFFNNYNMQAYILIPGIFFILFSKKISTFFKSLTIIFFLFCLFLTKSKIIILVLYFILIILFLNFIKIKILEFRRVYFFFIFIAIFFFYGIITHFLISFEGDINFNENYFFLHYYTRYPIIELFDLNIYGSLFFKLKSMALMLSDTNNYFFFNGINFKELPIFYKEYEQGIYPHSEYFGNLANFGIFGLLLYLIFMYYPVILTDFRYKQNILPYLIIVSIFLIEALIADTLHMQFLWFLILGLLNLKSKII